MKTKPNSLLGSGLLCCLLLTVFSGCKKEEAHTQPDAIAGEKALMSSTSAVPATPEHLRLDTTFTQTPFAAQLTWDAPQGVDVLVYGGTGKKMIGVVSANYFKEFRHWAFRLDNLQQDSTYGFRVQAQREGRSPISAPFTFRSLPTNDHLPPSVPGHLVLTFDQLSITARWDVSTDNYDPPGEIVYELYNAQTGGLVRSFKNITSIYIWTDNSSVLQHCKTYVVRARDRTGNRSAPSNPARTAFTGCP